MKLSKAGSFLQAFKKSAAGTARISLLVLLFAGVTHAGQAQPPVKDGQDSGSVFVMQEIPTRIVLSNTDVNRITCPNGTSVKDVVYSTEKGVSVKNQGTNAFVKFLVSKDNLTGKQKYRTDPVEFYVVCGDNQIFTLISTPKSVPAQHIQLVSNVSSVKKNLDMFKGISFERKIIMICQNVYTNNIPDSFSIKKVDNPLRVFEDIDVVLKRVVLADGEGIRLKEYVLLLKESGGTQLELNERDFLVPELAENPIAIALETHTLQPDTPRRLFVLERGDT
jgi:conjugal transfer pilus assembly protein TraK